MKPLTHWLTLACAFALIPEGAFGEDVVKETPAGGINWTQGIVYANGYGTAKPGLSPAQHRILSRRAAVVDAQRNLLEMTKGVRINSVVKADDVMKESREVVTRVEGIIKGARVVKDHYQNDVATVTLAMPISGDFLKVVWPRDRAMAGFRILKPEQWRTALAHLAAAGGRFVESLRFFPTARAAESIYIENEAEANAYRKLLEWMKKGPDRDMVQMLDRVITDYETTSKFSGLLVDASGVPDFELATIPQIRDEEGNIIYPDEGTSYDHIVDKRGVTYDFDIQDAVRNQRVATRPFVVKALSTYKNLASDLTIRKEDANRIKQSASTVSAMRQAGVLIVVGL